MKNRYSEKIAGRIRDALTRKGYNFFFNEETRVFHFFIFPDGLLEHLWCTVYVETAEFEVCARIPVGMDEENPAVAARLAEYVCRVNKGSQHTGGFEIDYYTGEIYYRAVVECADDLPLQTVYNCFGNMERRCEQYGDGFLAAVASDIPVEEIVQDVFYKDCKRRHKRREEGIDDYADDPEDQDDYGDDGECLDEEEANEPDSESTPTD